MNAYKENNKESNTKKEMFMTVLEDISIYNEFTLQVQYDGFLTSQR